MSEDLFNFSANGNGHGRELTRTPSYYVLSQHRAESLFAQLRRYEGDIATRQQANRVLRDRIEVVSNQLVIALHELALERREEPLLFIRTWLASHHGSNATGERR